MGALNSCRSSEPYFWRRLQQRRSAKAEGGREAARGSRENSPGMMNPVILELICIP